MKNVFGFDPVELTQPQSHADTDPVRRLALSVSDHLTLGPLLGALAAQGRGCDAL
jgi:hypothetical protein